jgi:hypothetical protein
LFTLSSTLALGPPGYAAFVENKGETAIRPNGHRTVEALFSHLSGVQSKLLERTIGEAGIY